MTVVSHGLTSGSKHFEGGELLKSLGYHIWLSLHPRELEAIGQPTGSRSGEYWRL